MRAPAILSTLLPKNHRVLLEFAQQHPGTTILSPREYMNEQTRQQLLAAGCGWVALDSLIPAEQHAEIHAELQVRQDQLTEALADPGWSERWQSYRIAAADLADCLSEEAAARLPALIPLLASLHEAVQQFAIRLVVVNEDLTPVPRLLIAWARQRGIASLQLSHSLLLCEPYTVHGYIHADVTAVFGERGLDGYKDIGVDPRRLRVTGNPVWDDYPQLRQRRAELRTAVADKHGLSRELPIVVFGTTWSANLSALGDEGLYGKTLRAFLRSCQQLRAAGVALQPVVKDRPTAEGQSDRLRQLLAELELPADSVCVAFDDVTHWVLAADVLVSVQSNLSVEAMLAQVPAVNLLTELGMALGPCFAADDGVLEVEDEGLAQALADLLQNPALRAEKQAAMQQAVLRHNAGADGRATERVVALMNELALPEYRGPVWSPPPARQPGPSTKKRSLPRALRDAVAYLRARYLAGLQTGDRESRR